MRGNNHKSYGHILSLGYNCEVSYQFYKKYKFVESSLFAWVNAINIDNITNAIRNMDKIVAGKVELSGVMWRDANTGILFHGTNPDILHADAAAVSADKENLISRINHLKEKFKNAATDGKKNLYVFKYKTTAESANVVKKKITALYDTLNKFCKNSFDLLIVMEADFVPSLQIENIDNLFVRRVHFFSDENDVTGGQCDRHGWDKIFNEFRPNFKLPKTKKFKFENASNHDARKTKKYDLVFSIGEACSCTDALRHAGLQDSSYPLDWLFGTDFIGRCKILASKFDRFIEMNDLEYVFSVRSISCDAYHNKYNDLTFNHDFLQHKDLSETYPAVHEKYMRRISRLLHNMKSAKKILIVYIEAPITDHPVVSDDMLKQGYDIIRRAFPKYNIDLLYFTNSDSTPSTVQVSDHIVRITDDYKDKQSELDYNVVRRKLVDHLKRIKLNRPLSTRIKTRTQKFIIRLIPVKSLRHRLKRKYHVR